MDQVLSQSLQQTPVQPFAPSNDLLSARVRAAIATVVRNPGAIDVLANQGTVVLGGPVLADEAEALVRAAERVPGVIRVESQLQRVERPDDVVGIPRGPELARPDRYAVLPVALRYGLGVLALGALVFGGWRFLRGRG